MTDVPKEVLSYEKMPRDFKSGDVIVGYLLNLSYPVTYTSNKGRVQAEKRTIRDKYVYNYKLFGTEKKVFTILSQLVNNKKSSIDCFTVEHGTVTFDNQWFHCVNND